LDGTTNFLHGIPHWAISIALERRLPDGGSEVAAGVVYSPVNNEMFWAEKGAGAYVNDKRLRVSARRALKDAVFATGVPFAATSGANRLAFARTLSVLMPQIAGVRRFGSAALDLAWTAAGRYDGYWEMGIKPWDIAAGMLIVREAGGYATDEHGKDVVAGTVVAANPHLHPKLLEVVVDGLAASQG
jgi:myo-inositol-1(or 4)-monophosphatase